MNAMLDLPRLLLDFGAVHALPEELSQLGIRKPLLISDPGLSACGVLARVRSAAPDIRDVFDRVTENPVLADCDAAAALYRAGDCDGIVALGGGSVIDASKLTAVIAGHGGQALDFATGSKQVTRAVVPLVVVPTTAGTGSEASSGAGVHPDSTSRTYGIASCFILPKLALCDPELTITLPPSLTAATGIDALTHCVEGYLATTVSPPADAMALDGIRRIVQYLERATRDGTEREARWHMMLAAFEGGAAIGKGLGPAHAIAICCGEQGVHHGKLSAIGLVASLSALEEPCAERLRDVAAAMGLAPGTTVRDGLLQLMRRLHLPVSLAEAGYKVHDLDELAASSAANWFNETSPYQPNAAEYKAMLGGVMG